MTREEAWRRAKGYLYDALSGEEADEIIKALEQEPCEDCISRQAALSMQYRIDDSVTLSTRDVVNVDDIENLPSVIPQIKTGHWMEDEYEMVVRCSECGEENDECSKYCPNCGAKTVEPQESEEEI